MQIIDAHCHFWRLDRKDYGWLQGQGGSLAAIRRDFLPSDYPARARMIVVQAAPTLAETDFLLSLAGNDPRIAGVVGWVDLSDPASAEALARRAGNPLFKGIRPMLQDIDDTDWLIHHARPDVLDAMRTHGLRFDALVTARHLPMLAHFADRYAGLPLVIDHAAKPQPGPHEDWRTGMRALAGMPHVYCKLSGLLTEFLPLRLPDPLPALQGIVADLLEWFGPGRLIWGSDWPVLTLAASYDDWQMLTDRLLGGLPDADRAAILGGNAAHFYGVNE